VEEAYSPQPGSEKYGFGWSSKSSSVKLALIHIVVYYPSNQGQQDIVLSKG